jgi:hypothetical protein
MDYSWSHQAGADLACAKERCRSSISFFYTGAQHNNENFSTMLKKLNHRAGQFYDTKVAAHLLSRDGCLDLGALHCLARFQTQKVQTADSLGGT